MLRVALLAGLLLLAGCENRFVEEHRRERARGPQAGEPAPAYAARTLDGDTVELASLRGHVVLLNFWATWCKPCIAEFPAFQRLEAEYSDAGLRIVAVSIDGGGAAVVGPFVRERGLTWTQLLDSEAHVRSTFRWSRGVPKTLLIDRDGTVRAYWIGPVDPFTPRNLAAITDALAAAR
jgi:cytochrome c biogenesis protein CcmG, thiol:disulfide interchange protein DsbE